MAMESSPKRSVILIESFYSWLVQTKANQKWGRLIKRKHLEVNICLVAWVFWVLNFSVEMESAKIARPWTNDKRICLSECIHTNELIYF